MPVILSSFRAIEEVSVVSLSELVRAFKRAVKREVGFLPLLLNYLDQLLQFFALNKKKKIT